MPHANTDRNLLFGILALQMDFISRDALIHAMNSWVLEKSKPLGEILLRHNALSSERRTLLESLVREHLKAHEDAPSKSLAALAAESRVHEQLKSLADSELEESLAQLSTWRDKADPHATRNFSFNEGVRAGQRFRVLRPHAKGGLGEVFVALDEELHREVALKEIQTCHADDITSRARFLLEAEITGGLEHPGIVPVYGLGQYVDGRPYYAMRFIKGASLKEAIASFHKDAAREVGKHSLELHKLLGRFLAVCNAMSYAHSRGVLHRDIKPANIMLGDFGETLVVDWGLAKALDKEELDAGATYPRLVPTSSSSGPTEMGAVLGTPAFMSPEQAAGRLDQMGPASDVYSLGATLYNLLTGQAPFKAVERGELLRQVQQGEFATPCSLDKSINPGLEAICLKAMAVRPVDRYPLPRDLADDLEHWLADEPVSAWPEPWTVKTRRWVNRHRTAVAGVAAAVIVAAVSLGAATYFLSRANHDLDVANQNERTAKEDAVAQKERATESYRLARQGLEAAVAIKDDERLKSGKLEDLRKKIAQAEANFYEKFVGLRGEEPAFRFERAMAYSKLGVANITLGNHEEGVHNYETVVAILEQLREEFPDDLRYQDELQQHYNDIGFFSQDLKRLGKAEEILLKGQVIQQSLVQVRPENKELKRVLAMTITNLGVIYRDTQRMNEAEKAFKDALEIIEPVTHNCSKTGKDGLAWSCLANVHTHLGYLYSLTGRAQLVVPERKLGIKIWKELVEANPRQLHFQGDLALGYHFLGMTYQFRSEWSLAEANYLAALDLRRKLVAQHPALADLKGELADSYYQLAWIYQNTDRMEMALEEYPKIIAVFDGLSTEYPNDPNYKSKLAWAYNDMAALFNSNQKNSEAGQVIAKAVAIRRSLVKDYPGIAEYQDELMASLDTMANNYQVRNQYDKAQRLYEGALEIGFDLCRKNPKIVRYKANLAHTQENLGVLYHKIYRFHDAIKLHSRALEQYLELASSDPKNLSYQDYVVRSYREIARSYGGLGQNDEALAAQEKAISYREKMVKGATSQTDWAIDLAELYTGMGLYVSQGKTPAEALKWNNKAIEHLTPLAGRKGRKKEANRALGAAYAGLGLVQSKYLGQNEEAIRNYDQALKIYPEKDDAWILLYRAYAVARKGEHADAAKTAEEIVKKPSATALNLKDAAGVLALAAASAKMDPKLAEGERAKLVDQYSARAVELLTKAQDAGYFKNLAKDDRRITDKDLDPLRERSDFKEFVKRLEEKK
ncbi:MAG: protein kinase domain-containing protein [Gemmataceae bacterium]